MTIQSLNRMKQPQIINFILVVVKSCIYNLFWKNLTHIFFEALLHITITYKINWKGDPLEIKHQHFENRRLLIKSVHERYWTCDSRKRLALEWGTLYFHFNVEPHSPEGPENVKVKYPQFENSRLGLIESFHERYWKMRQLSCPLSLPKYRVCLKLF